MPDNTINGVAGILNRSIPYTTYQYVTVTFPSGANTDLDIPHTLTPLADPDEIVYEIVKKDRACDIYNDQTGTRKAWTSSTIYLRSTVASATVILRLSLRRT